MMAPFSSPGIRRGFSLIEVILYVALSAIILTTLLRVALTVLDVESRTRASGAVQHSLDMALTHIVVALRDAHEIDVAHSAFDVDRGAIELVMSGSDVNPTRFELNGSEIFVRHGAGSPSTLTSSGVVIDQLLFRDLTPAGSRSVVQVQIHGHGTSLNPSGRFEDERTLRTSVTLRP